MKLVGTNRVVKRLHRAAALAGFALMFGEATAGVVTYEVSPASGRVTKATYPDGTYITYNYDANGNRISAVITDLGVPTAPGMPSFSSIGATSATASWTPATDNVAVTGYQYRVNSGSWVSVTNSPASLTGLSGATLYTVEVRAKDNANNFGPASSNSFTTLDNGAPTAPGTPTFSSVTATSATATWTAATDNVAVIGYQYSLNGGAWIPNGTSLSVALSSLTTATEYTFRVRAFDGATNTGPERSNSFTTLDNMPPNAPGSPSFTSIGQNSATASWTAATDNVAVTGYEYSLNGGTWTSNGISLSVNLTGLTAATGYTVQVRARDAANNPGPASSNSFSTVDTTNPTVPGTPSFSSITASSATASWTAATDNVAVTSYEYSLSGGAWTSNGASLTLNLTSLSASTSYTLQVRAKDAANNPGSASSNSFTTLDNVAPSPPGTPTFGSITGSTATASWTAATDNVGILRYEYSLNGGGWTSVGSALSVNLTGLTAAGSYTFQIRAIDTSGNPGSASSNSFTTIATVAIPNAGYSTVRPGGATASYQLTAGGDIYASQPQNTTSIDVGDWLSPKTGMSSFQVRATLTSGTCSSGPIGTWVDLNVARMWTRSVTGTMGAVQQCNFLIEVRHSGNPSVVLDTANIALTAIGQ